MSVELRRNGSQFRWCIWQDRLSFIFVWIKQLFDFIQAMSVFGKSQGDKYYKGSSKDSSWASAKISMSRDACMLKYCFLYLRRITTFFGKRVSKQRTLCWALSHTRITPPTIKKMMDPLPHMVALQPRWVAHTTNTVRSYTPGTMRTVLSYSFVQWLSTQDQAKLMQLQRLLATEREKSRALQQKLDNVCAARAWHFLFCQVAVA